MGVLFLALAPLAARYQMCNFSCTGSEEQWVACRSEKCTPRLPEDACADGNEATLVPVFGETDAAADGFVVTGPQECDTLLFEDSDQRLVPSGSFQERCELCMGVVTEAIRLVHLALSMSSQKMTESSGADEVCDQAAAEIERTLATIRTCRLHPPACALVVRSAREAACPKTYTQLIAAVSTSSVRADMQSYCGQLVTQRNGSDVTDATVCPVPRDVGARVMAISAVVATSLFIAQWFRI